MSRTAGRFLVAAMGVLAIVSQLCLAAAPDKPAADSAHFEAYAKSDGASYFALSLMPQTALPPAENCDLVVLVDTSASQVGAYREKSLETLRGMLATLGDKDRVKLMAVDVNAVPMTSDFVAPNSPEMKAALQKLQNRVPLGATDLEAALNAAIKSIPAESTTQHAAIYFGAGRSNANMNGIDVAGLIDQLVKNRISIHSFAVGPTQNSAVLASLANQTGGVLVFDGDKITGAEAGSQLSHAAHGPIIWPSDRKLPASLAEAFPTRTPPLRSDRDTILIGKGSATDDFAVQIDGESAGKPVNLEWNVTATKPNDDNAFLAQLTSMAETDGGLGLPTLGSEGLWEVRRVLNMQAHSLAKLGQQAAATGDMQKAKQFVNAAMERDPNDSNALVLKRSLDQTQFQPGTPPPPAPGDVEPPRSQPGDLLNSVEQRQQVIQQQVMTEATVDMNRARDKMTSDPGAVIDDLKRLMDRVLRVTELTSEQRADLRGRISTLLQQANQSQMIKDAADAERQQNLAAARDRQRTLDRIERTETQLDGLIDRFNALVEQGYQNADQVTNDYLRAARRDAADQFRRAASNPYGREPVAATTAPMFASFVVYQTEDMAVKEAAERNYMDTLHLVDISHIPFPDSPPIVYPDAAFWRKITKDRKKFSAVDLSSTNPTEQKILNTLSDQKTSVDVAEQPLAEWVTYLSDKFHIPIQFDTPALRDATIDPATIPVGVQVKDISLRSALKLILSQHSLTYVIKDEVLMITTNDKANTQLVTKVYPVADLVLPVQTIQPNNSQLGGGIGGGSQSFGGGFGGGGGGGFGGGGGGFGGGGGGLGGGGFGGGGFNLPRERGRMILPAPNSSGAFDVGDADGGAQGSAAPAKEKKTGIKLQDSGARNQASASNSTVSATLGDAKSNSRSASPSTAKPIVVKDSGDPVKFWNDYFASLREPDEQHSEAVYHERNETIRATAKELMSQHKFDQVSALLGAALRNGYAQPWMYEGLALSLQAQNAPKEEVERALMSAVDFAKSATDLMNVAVYMARVGFDARALKVMRQASALEPFRHEPYMHGLKIAQRLNDADGIRWACLGVLSQAWPNDKKEVAESAQFAADALLEKLQHDGNTAKADDFRHALAQAKQRDCRVEVRWSGNADIDLTVEEPTGAVCSLHAPRSSGGGVMQGDTYVRLKSGANDGSAEFSQSYVLPQGFSGQYKVLVRRIWGQVATGKVTVDVYTHDGTPEVVHVCQQIPVSDRDALVTFDLADGRRKEPLAQAQLANAAADQMAVSRSVLAQQISALADASSGSSGSSSTGSLPQVPGTIVVNNQNGLPFFRGNAVGYQPVITTLSEGAQMSASAVISADRRYVRINAVPFFSSIGPVSTFNFATGAGGTTAGGGTGAGGATGIGGGGTTGVGGGGAF
jgi:von Willebrand factor type A domain